MIIIEKYNLYFECIIYVLYNLENLLESYFQFNF